MTPWQVHAFTAAGVDLGPVDVFTQLQLRLRLNGVGSFSLTLGAESDQAALLGPGGRVAAWAPGDTPGVDAPTLAGQCRAFEKSPRSVQDPGAEVTWSGVDDWWLLSTRLCLPSPAAADTQQGGRWTATGPVETVLKQLVDANLGPSARADRARPGLTVAADQGRGPTVTVSARYDTLSTLVAATANAAGFATTVTFDALTGGLVFDATPATDLSAAVSLSRSLGNLTSWRVAQSAPTATVVLCAGQGQMDDRTIVPTSQPDTAWGGERIEVFQDRRDTDDQGDLSKQGVDTLAASAASGSVAVTTADIPGLTFGADYRLGDVVTAVVDDVQVVDTVRAVTVTVPSDGPAVVSPMVGPAGQDADELTSTQLLLALRERVSRLEKGV